MFPEDFMVTPDRRYLADNPPNPDSVVKAKEFQKLAKASPKPPPAGQSSGGLFGKVCCLVFPVLLFALIPDVRGGHRSEP